MGLKRRNKVEATFAMSSMTDLIFLLLLFFIMASTMSAPNDIKINLPEARSTDTTKPQMAKVSIDNLGQYFIAVGDAQSLGIPMQWGGPYVGYMCCTEKLIRKMPGRIVGRTVDNRGQRAFVLTLQAREQHIRRQKATSNICSNQSLMALWVTVYCSLMGKQGLREAAELSYSGAHYLCDKLIATGHFTLVYDKPFFNEFVVRFDGDANILRQFLLKNDIFGGVMVAEDQIMFAVTEKRTKEEIDRMVEMTNFYQGVN